MNISLYANRILRPIAEKKKEDIFDSIAIKGMRASPGPGNINGGGSPNPPEPDITLGELANDSFASLSDWTESGSGDFDLVPGGLQVSTGNASYNNYIYFNPSAFAGHRFKISIRFTVNVAGAGIAVGINNRQNISLALQNSKYVKFNSTTNTLIEVSRDGASTVETLTAVLAETPGASDVLEIGLERHLNSNRVYFRNITTGYYVSRNRISPNPGGNNTGHFSIFSVGGTHTVSNVTISSGLYLRAKATFVGDSITNGTGATTLSTRYSNQAFKNSDEYFQLWGGSGDVTEAVQNSLPYLIDLDPEYVVLMIGGNDVGLVADGVYRPRYQAFTASMEAAGIIVIHCLATPRNNKDLRDHNTWINTTFAGGLIVDLFTPLLTGDSDLNSIYDSGDGVHPNDAGYSLMGSTLISTVTALAAPTALYSENTLHVLKNLDMNLSAAKKAALNTFIVAETANGNWPARINDLCVRKLGGDSALMSLKGNFETKLVDSILASDGIQYDGTNFSDSGFDGGAQNGNFTNANFGFGFLLVENGSGTNSDTALGGIAISTNGTWIKQNAGIVTRCLVTVDETDTGSFVNGNLYDAVRSSAANYVPHQNGVSLGTVARAAGAIFAGTMYEGAVNSDRVDTNNFTGKIGDFVLFKFASFNFVGFYTNLTTLNAGL